MDVFDNHGKKLGTISDISLDVQNLKVDGFIINRKVKKGKHKKVKVEDIIAYDTFMVVNKSISEKSVIYNHYSGCEVIDESGNIIGTLNDISFDKEFNIKAYMISEGLIKRYKKGKKILLPNKCIFGDWNILYKDDSTRKVQMYSLRHSIIGDNDDKYYKTSS